MDPKARFTFNQTDAEELLQGIGGTPPPSLPVSVGGKSVAYILQAPGGGIAARSGSSISSASCTVYGVSGGVLSSTGLTIPVYNMSTTAVAASAYIIALWASGVMVCNWEDC